MSVALQAALTMMGEKNHPGIMQTSAEQLITILSNIASDPAEKKYRKLKITNRMVSEKVLPAQGAKPLLLAVGFAQVRERPSYPMAGTTLALFSLLLSSNIARVHLARARFQDESHAVLIMQGRDVDTNLLRAAIDGLQRLLSDKAERCDVPSVRPLAIVSTACESVWSRVLNREAAERAEVVAKNRAVSAKMREAQAVEKERKDELGKTIKQQQEYDRLEKSALDSPAKGDFGMGATQALQQLYTANGAADGRAVDGYITVRIATPDGQNNLRLKQSATFGDLRRQIEDELQIPGSVQIIGLDRSFSETISSDRVKLKSKGVTNGSIIGLKYPGFTRTDKVSQRCLRPYLPCP